MGSRVDSVPVTQIQLAMMALEKFRDQYGDSLSSKFLWIFRRVLFFLRSWFMDLEYNTMSEELLAQLLNEWKNNVLPNLHYSGECFDCDDYARYFQVWLKQKAEEAGLACFNGVGLALGVLYTPDGEVAGGHAWNIVLAHDSQGQAKLYYVEPQLGEIVDGQASDGFQYELMAVII